jgi:poly(3-hydroxybutyrate) depolymerase
VLLYQAYQAQRDLSAPVLAWAGLSKRWIDRLPPSIADTPAMRQLAASYDLISRSHLTHERPAFGVHEVLVNGELLPVTEEVVQPGPFGDLLRFSVPPTGLRRPKVLLVTALAGHFSTLLRHTISTLVADHDVYVTDWHNARDVPLDEGVFGLDDYIDQVIRFLERVGPGSHVMAVCQPCPATLAAASIMAAGGHECQPRTLTLMAGPVDTSISPTKVNEVAHSRSLDWFERNVITTVPLRYAGAGRRVYPGFLQVGGFVTMNIFRHASRHIELWDDLANGRSDQAQVTEDFYDEYFAVLDMAAEFYLQTIDRVFQRNLLARGMLTWRGQQIEPAAITRTALLTIEGANDDICGLGQTLAAQDLCTSLKPTQRLQHLQAGAGHYGVFSGRRWEQSVYPVVRNFIQTHDG